MSAALSRLARILSLVLAVSLAVSSSWPQETQPAPAKPPDSAPPPQAPPPQAPPAQPAPPQPAPAKPAPPQTGPAPAPEPSPEAETPQAETAPVEKGATLQGRVLGSDRRTPVEGAVVYAVGPGGKVASSPPTGAKGKYVLSGLQPGTYVLAVSVEGNVFSLENPVGVTSARNFTVDLATVPAEAATAVPGVEGKPKGFCFIVQGKKEPGATNFWWSKKGIIVLAVTAGAIVGILAESGKSEEQTPVSPSVP